LCGRRFGEDEQFKVQTRDGHQWAIHSDSEKGRCQGWSKVFLIGNRVHRTAKEENF
jgi:hypothetical protein